MKTINFDEVWSAERIAVPKGENNEAYRKAFQIVTDLEIPTPKPGKLSARSAGRQFFWLRGIDIPEKVDLGLVDVGLMGTDALLDYENYDNLRSRSLGPTACRFSVLTAPDKVESFRQFMSVERRYLVPMVWMPTSRPRALERISEAQDYPFRACGLKISGSVEAYAELTGAGAIAELTATGTQAAANDLAEAMKLFDICGELTMKAIPAGEGGI
jgi:ATP phosphoribosyltransferase